MPDIVHPIDQTISQVRAVLNQHGIPFCLIFPRPSTVADRVEIALTANMPPETIQGVMRGMFQPSEATKAMLVDLLNSAILEALKTVEKSVTDLNLAEGVTLEETHTHVVESLLPALLQTLELQGIQKQKQSSIILPG